MPRVGTARDGRVRPCRSRTPSPSSIGRTPLVRLGRIAEGTGGADPRQARVVQPGRLGQGPHRPGDDRGRRGRGPPGAGHERHRRAHLGQHRHRPRLRRGGQGLPLHPHDARDDERGAAHAAARLRRRAGAHAGRRGHARRHRQGRGDRRGTPRAPSCPQQFQNPANPEVHRRTTAEEIWADTDGAVDILVAGVGTGGSITGVAEVLSERRPGFRAIAVEPADSPVLSGGHARARTRSRGSAPASCPGVLNTDVYDEVIDLSPPTTPSRCRAGWRARRASSCGISAGANVWAALEVGPAARERRKADRHVPLRHGRALSDDAALRRGLRRPPLAESRRGSSPDGQEGTAASESRRPTRARRSQAAQRGRSTRPSWPASQIELVKMHEWVRHTGLQAAGDLRGARRRRQGRGHQAHHREPQPAHLPRGGPARADRARADASGTSSATSRTCRRGGEIVLFDRSWYNRAGVERVMGFCTEEEYREFLRTCPEFERMLIRSGHHPGQVLVLGERRGAGAPLPGPHRRPDQALEAQPDGPRSRASAGSSTRGPRTRCSPTPTPSRRRGTWSRPTTSGAPASTASATC